VSTDPHFQIYFPFTRNGRSSEDFLIVWILGCRKKHFQQTCTTVLHWPNADITRWRQCPA